MIHGTFAENGRINVVVEHAFIGLDKAIQGFFDASTATAGINGLRRDIASHTYRLKNALPQELTQVADFDLSRAAEANFGRAGLAFARIYNAAVKVESATEKVDEFFQAVAHLRRTMRDAHLYVYNQGGADERDIALGRVAVAA